MKVNQGVSKHVSIVACVLAFGVVVGCSSDDNTTTAAAPSGGTSPAPAPAPAPASPAPAAAGGSGGLAVGQTATLNGGSLKAEQKTASDLVTEVNGGVSLLVKSKAADSAPGGIAVTTQCKDIVPGSTGSFTVDTNVTGASLAGSTTTITYNACNLYGFTYSGTIAYTYNSYTDFNNYTVTTTYTNLSFGTSDVINGSESCTVTAGAINCGNYFNGYRVSNATATTNGSNTTVGGTVSGATGYGNADCVYNGWTYNGTRATSGTVTLNYGNGNQVVITAGATSYSVRVTINGTTTTYTV